MKRMRTVLNAGTRVGICAAVALTMVSGAVAQDDFELNLDPIVLEAIFSNVDTDSSKFNEYGDETSGFRIPELVIEGYSPSTDRHLGIWGRDIYRDNARITMQYGVVGKYGLDLDYNRIPHRFGNNAIMLWNQTSPGRLELADSTQANLQAQIEAAPSRNFDFIEGLITPYLDSAGSTDLGLQRNRFAGTFEAKPMQKFSWAVDYKQEDRKGNRQFGGMFGFNNPNELPEPIDYISTEAALRGEWTGKKSGVQFGYRMATFENDVDTLIWDNPYRVTDATNGIAYLAPTTTTAGPVLGLIDLAPDNEANTLFVNGRTRFADSWWVNGSVVSTNMKQNDTFNPFTLNTAIVGIDHQSGETFDPTDPGNLPAGGADLSTDVLALRGDVGGKLGENFRLKLTYDYYDLSPDVPRLEFDGYVRAHAVWEAIPRVTVPFDYTREKVGGKLTWDANDDARFSLSYDMKAFDRTNRETHKTDEDLIRLTYDHRLGSKTNLRASWENGDRTHSGYETEAQEATFLDPEGINNQPGLRKYAQANREYDDYRVDVFFHPSATTELMFGLSSLDEEYPESEFGLQSYELMSYNFDFSYTPGEHLNFFVFGHLGESESFQRGRQSGGTLSESFDDDWDATLTEDNDLFGVGLNADMGEKWRTEIIAQWSNADGDARFFTTPLGSPSSFENFSNYDDTDLFFIKVNCILELGEQSSIGFRYWYEDFTLSSFLTDDLSPYSAGLLAMIPSNGDYTANVGSVYLSFDF